MAGLLSAATSGFLLGGSLIVAIGAQNAFILRQGLLREHVFVLCLICSLADAMLIAAGVGGLGTLVASSPKLITVVTIGGAIFLACYAVLAFRRAVHPETLRAARGGKGSLKAAVAACLAFPFLNPHVYLDTVVLLGTISTQFPGSEAAFAAGAITGSFLFFFALGFGARWLRPLFVWPASWRVLEAVIGVTMAAIALRLLLI